MALLETVQTLLEGNQFPCVIAYPNRRMPRLLQPTVMLCVKERRLSPFCHGNVIGTKSGSDIHALAFEESLECEIYSPYLSGGDQCDVLTDSLLICISEVLVQQVLRSVERRPTYYDPDTDCFRSSIVIESESWIYSYMQ